MSEERITKTETDFWGNEREVVYENGRKVGEVNIERRGSFFGIGGEDVRVERDNSGNEVNHTKSEMRGSFFGLGGERVDVTYDPNESEIGTSRLEQRGGLFGFGAERVRVHRDNEGNENAETRRETRGGFFGFGGERVRVTKPSAEYRTGRAHERPAHEAWSGGGVGGGGVGGGSIAGAGWGLAALLVGAIVTLAYFTGADDQERQSTPTSRVSPPPLDPESDEAAMALTRTDWAGIQFSLRELRLKPGIISGYPHGETRLAISEWQHRMKLNPTGYLNKYQFDLLRKSTISTDVIFANQFLNYKWAWKAGCWHSKLTINKIEGGIVYINGKYSYQNDGVINAVILDTGFNEMKVKIVESNIEEIKYDDVIIFKREKLVVEGMSTSRKIYDSCRN